MDVDLSMSFNSENFKEKLSKDMYLDKNNLDMEPFPSPLVLAQLAEAVYSDRGDSGHLPTGWKILTFYSNNHLGNGYFGAAYCNPSLQQVVIAHRGTETTNLGALWTDLKGVVANNYTSQMSSAVTFSDRIMRALRQECKKSSVPLQLSVTGHSLGGWLAQVTAFTLKYVEVSGDRFIEVRDRQHNRHVHAVTFDSPGCGKMLNKIIADGYCRYGRTVFSDDLDVTNYLAPPNKFNTAGSHVGAIYEVCFKISNMSDIEYKLLYTKIIHPIKNFVEAFKDGKEIHEVLNWPVSYKELFSKGCTPDSEWWTSFKKELRYETKNVEANSCNLRTFSETGLYLLKMWSALKLETLTTDIIDKFVQDHNLGTGNLFSEFKMDNKSRTVTCPSEPQLRAVIRHTELLMRWFGAEFTEAVELQCKQIPRAGALIYRMASQNYLKTLPECHFHFRDTIELKAFLESSDARILQINTEDSQFEVARLRDILARVRYEEQLQQKYLSEDNQSFMDVKHIEYLERTINIDSLYKSEYHSESLMVMDCATPGDVNQDWRRFLERIENDVNKKLIYILPPLIDYKCLLAPLETPRDEITPCKNVGLTDLTEESQKDLFERKMLIVDGKELSWADYVGVQNLTSFLSFINTIIDSQTFKSIVTDRRYTIRVKNTLPTNLPLQNYMERKFNQQIVFNLKRFAQETDIDKSLFVFQNETDKRSLLRLLPEGTRDTFMKRENIRTAVTAEEADDIVRENPNKSIHIVQREVNSARFLWQRSRGSLDALRPHVTTDASGSKGERDLCETCQKVLVIVDEPGMGKSTSLASMSLLLKSSWVIWVDLKNFKIPIEDLPDEPKQRCEFLLDVNLNHDTWLVGLMDFCLHHEQSRQVYFMFDGFDELKNNHSSKINTKNEILKLLSYLSEETTARVWVTTRLHERNLLEDALSTFAVTFEKIEEQQQREYLVSTWRSYLPLETTEGWGDEKQNKLEVCAQALHTKAKENLGKDVQSFMGVPLQMRMLAEVFQQQVKDCIQAQTDIGNAFKTESASILYEKFIIVKHNIYFKHKTRLDGEMSSEVREAFFSNIKQAHRMLGLRTLFPDFAEKHYEDFKSELGGAELCRIGLVQSAGNGSENIEFIHRTLAEYFCADLIVHWLSEKARWPGWAPTIKLLLTDIFLRNSHNIIRMFINHFFLQHPTSDATRECTAEQIGKISKEKAHLLYNQNHETALHLAVLENNNGIIDFLISGLKSGPAQHGLIGVIAAHNRTDNTALGLASMLAEYDPVNNNYTKIMEKHMESIDNCPYEIKLELLLATYIKGAPLRLLCEYIVNETNLETETAFSRTQKIITEDVPPFLAAVQERRMIDVKKLYSELENDIERHYILFARNCDGNTALHIAALDTNSQIEIIKILCDYNISGIEKSYNSRGDTPLHCAAKVGHLDIVQHLVNHGMPVNCTSESSRTALHDAAGKGHLTVVEYLIEKGLNINSVDQFGYTALHTAAEKGRLLVVRHLVENGVNIDDVAKGGHNALYNAAEGGHLPVVKYLIEKGANIRTVNYYGNTALHSAAELGHFPMVKLLVEKGVDINSVDRYKNTVLHPAVAHGHLKVVEYLIMKGVDANSVNTDGCTALHTAAKAGHFPVVEYLVGKGVNINSVNKYKNTVLHLAAEQGHLEVVEYFIKKGVDINSVNNDDNSALHTAANAGHLPVVEYLVGKGVDIKSVNTPIPERSTT